MAKAALGEKQICPNCSAKFYDLGRRPATCPKCQTAFDPAEEGVRVKRTRVRSANYQAAYEDDEEAEEAETVAAGDEDEEEAEDAPEVDAEADDPPVALEDDEDETPASGDELPPGFSEEEADLDDDADSDDVPLLEDEEEFPEDEIGEIPSTDDEESR